MIRPLLAATLVFSILAASPTLAAPCKDSKTGKFTKCPEKPVPAAKCKNAKGQFAKCGTPGAKPI